MYRRSRHAWDSNVENKHKPINDQTKTKNKKQNTQKTQQIFKYVGG